ncbi:hypothetical protein [Kocuria flava]|uniref:Uncharacterized protein n=1 Tax=Kocuria flava TaxID=446860 RepID=A0ABQ0X1R3_9MICC|nr:hypothetical protein [Kocuria flava]GEO91533.1 hypothetical protein KFL01_08390 [Kocuria flava]
MGVLVPIGLKIKRERIPGPVAEGRAAGKDFDERRQKFIGSPVRNIVGLLEGGELATHVARYSGIFGAHLSAGPRAAHADHLRGVVRQLMSLWLRCPGPVIAGGKCARQSGGQVW